MKTANDVLKSKQKEVWSISPKAMIFEALTIMAEKSIGALVVIDNKSKVVGIISERDYARKVILKGKLSKDTPVAEIMTPKSNMYTVNSETTLEECMVLMTGKHVRHVPVFDKDKFVGIISIGDIVKAIISDQQMLIDQLSNYIAGKYI